MAQVVDRAGLFFQACFNHLVHTAVDAVKQALPLDVEDEFDDSEITLLGGAGAQRGIGNSGLPTDFHGMAHAAGIAAVDRRGILRVQPFQFPDQAFQPLEAQFLLDGGAHLGTDVGQPVDAVAHRVDIEHRAAAHHHIVTLLPQSGQEGHDVALELSRAVTLFQVLESHKVMPHRRQLVGRGCGRTDGDAAINLTGIGIDDVAMQVTGQVDGRRRLAHSCGSSDDNQGLVHRRNIKPCRCRSRCDRC